MGGGLLCHRRHGWHSRSLLTFLGALSRPLSLPGQATFLPEQPFSPGHTSLAGRRKKKRTPGNGSSIWSPTPFSPQGHLTEYLTLHQISKSSERNTGLGVSAWAWSRDGTLTQM